MKHINDLNRSRPFKLFNLLPDEVTTSDPPAFFIPTHNLNAKIETSDPNKYDVSKNDKIKRTFRKAGQTATIVAHLSKRLMTKNTYPTLIKEQSSAIEHRKSKDFSQACPIKFVPYSISQSALFDKGCITCGKDNIKVKYFGERHICLRCRAFLRTQKNDRAYVFLNEEGDVEAMGKSKKEMTDQPPYYKIEPDQLWFKDYRCYATLAKEDELIVLLHDDQSIKKNPEK